MTATETDKPAARGASPAQSPARHRTVALVCVGVVAAMVGLSYAAVPLYRMFCQVTGYGGTTMRATKAPEVALDRTITVAFDANVNSALPWRFEAVQPTLEVRIGEQALAYYRATNVSDRPVTGTATYNVTPDIVGSYFSKIACFCFTEQTLQPGESIDMPVSFFVDPDIVKDPDARRVGRITLSYVFYPVAAPKAAAEAASPATQPPLDGARKPDGKAS